MITRFKSALNQIKADDALVNRTEAYLRDNLKEDQDNKVVNFKKRRVIYTNKKLAAAACVALFVICGGTGAYAYYKTPVSYLSLDINPSVELGVNSLGKVVKAEAYNNDGSTILKGVDVTGSSVSDAVKELVTSAADNGFIEKDGSSVISLTSETDNNKTAGELQSEAETGAEDALEQEGDTAEIQKDNVALARRDEARKLGITPGKLNLIQKLQAVDPTATVDQYKDAKVKDIMKSIKDAKNKSKSGKKDDSTDSSTASTTTSGTAGTTSNTTTGTTTSSKGGSKNSNSNSSSVKSNGNTNSNKNTNTTGSGSSNGNGSSNTGSGNGNGNGSGNGNGNGGTKPKTKP